MESAQQQVERLLADINEAVRHSPLVEKKTAEIEALTRAFLTPSVDPRWSDYGLTKLEQRLVALLDSNRSKIFSKDAIYDALYFDKPDGPDPKILDVFICRLRKQLRLSPYKILTHGRDGYQLVESIAA